MQYVLLCNAVQNSAAKFFKGLTKKSRQINKVPEQLYIDYENFKRSQFCDYREPGYGSSFFL